MLRAHPGLKKGLLATAALAVAFTGAMGFAHTKPGRPLLAVLGPLFGMRAHAGAGRCPFGFDARQDPLEKEAARRQFAASHRGASAPGARLALGFSLDRTTRAEVQAWAGAHHLKCTTPRIGADLDCGDVPSSALPADHPGPALASVWFNFNAREQLTAVIGIRSDSDPRPIAASFVSLRDLLSEKAGPPSAASGEATPAFLSAGLLRQASVEYRFSDYYALARAGNLGSGGYVLTEEYRSLN